MCVCKCVWRVCGWCVCVDVCVGVCVAGVCVDVCVGVCVAGVVVDKPLINTKNFR